MEMEISPPAEIFATTLVMLDEGTLTFRAMSASTKAASAYAADNVADFLGSLNLETVFHPTDGEPAIRALARAVKAKRAKEAEQKLKEELKTVKSLHRKAEAEVERMEEEVESLKKLKDAKDTEDRLKVVQETEAALRREVKEVKAKCREGIQSCRDISRL